MKLLKFAILFWLMISFIEGKGDDKSKADKPDPPVLLSASIINPEGDVELKWSQDDPENVVEKFQIFEWSYTFQNPVYESPNGFTYNTINTNTPANSKACIYYITNFGTYGTSPQNNIYHTIYLRDLSYDICSRKTTLKWGEYLLYRNVEAYKIWKSEDNLISWDLIETINYSDLIPFIIDTESLYSSLIWTDIYSAEVDAFPNTQYYYRIEAVVDDPIYNAFSNIVSFQTPPFNTPSNLLLENVTVNLDNEVEIFGSVTDLQFASSGQIERSLNVPFNPEYSIPLNISGPNQISEIDPDADPGQSSYYFRISLEDQCGVEINSSEFRTIHLHAELNGDSEVNLEWNEFVGWNVEKYNIYIQRQSAPTTWTQIDPSTTSFDFMHDLSSIPPEESMFKYRIKAVENNGNRISYSNTVTVYRSFDPVMPNAFYTGSSNPENRTFKPVITFYNSTNYLLQIYNRWGAVIWETNDPDEGWTGKNKSGKLQPKGVYVYLLQYEESADLVRTKRGTVTLIH
ncbi:MAG: gliding motility-associated C-terminal domain-containing protein [Bacteroidales bacterium]|nr:gliding motility-associated C-terminal domain-containing protein [Bacteroidales bacterium]